jgi:hypothetical protein
MEQGRVILQELTMLAASGSGGNVPRGDITCRVERPLACASNAIVAGPNLSAAFHQARPRLATIRDRDVKTIQSHRDKTIVSYQIDQLTHAGLPE